MKQAYLGSNIKVRAEQIIDIIETGNNEKGFWVKYYDGTMLQGATKDILSITVPANGNISFNGVEYPQTFVAGGNISVIDADFGTGGSNLILTRSGSTPSAVFGTIRNLSGSAITSRAVLKVIAIGRWK